MSSRRRTEENPGYLPNRGFSWVARSTGLQVHERESSCHDRRRLSSAPFPNRCRLLIPQPFASGYATFLPVARCFISAGTVTGASAIAVPVAATKPAACSAAKPIGVSSRVPKGVWIIATASASIGSPRARVTDQSSLCLSAGANLIAPPPSESVGAAPALSLLPSDEAEDLSGWVVCQICGRRGRWIDPFPEVKHDF